MLEEGPQRCPYLLVLHIQELGIGIRRERPCVPGYLWHVLNVKRNVRRNEGGCAEVMYTSFFSKVWEVGYGN